MENLIYKLCGLLDNTEYCVKDELEQEMKRNKVLEAYIITYCKNHDCDTCWSDLSEKIEEGDIEWMPLD